MADAWDRWLKAATKWYEDRAHLVDDRLEFKMPRDPRFRSRAGYWVEVRDHNRHLDRAIKRAVAETKRCEMLKSS